MISEQRLEGEERVGMLSSGDSGTRHCIAGAEALRQEHGWHVSRAAPGVVVDGSEEGGGQW